MPDSDDYEPPGTPAPTDTSLPPVQPPQDMQAIPSSWKAAGFELDFNEACRYARDGLPLDQKGRRTRVIHAHFGTDIIGVIENLFDQNPDDFASNLDNFVFFCTLLVLRTLSKHGVPKSGPMPTPLLLLDQLSRSAEEAQAYKKMSEDNVSMDFVLETATKAGDWNTICDQLNMLRDVFSQIKWASMRRLLESAQASRHALKNAVVKLNTLPQGTLSEKQHEQAQWWSDWFTEWGQPS